MKRTLNLLSVATLLFTVFCATAATPEDVFKRIRMQQQEAREKLVAAEKASGEKQAMMLAEHGKMMHMMMSDMRQMKPMDSMSIDEHKKWMTEHQKLMDEMLSQMLRDHELMQAGCMMKH